MIVKEVAYSSKSVQMPSFLERSRRKPAAQSIHKESASSGLLAQSAAVPIVLPRTLPGEG